MQLPIHKKSEVVMHKTVKIFDNADMAYENNPKCLIKGKSSQVQSIFKQYEKKN